MNITILTLFPEYFTTPLASSILKRAQDAANISFKVVNIRDFAKDKHKTTDDRPYGGGAGMVMKVGPIERALGGTTKKIILTSAKGELFTQKTARRYAKLEELVIICGHYGGVDERVAEHLVDEEVRVGDYVLTGGEPAAMIMTDAVVRLLPGVLGNEESNKGESHEQPGLLGYPQYTRPSVYNGWMVPEVLLSGDHKKIKKWQEEQRKKA